jgi:hypothetical protein
MVYERPRANLSRRAYTHAMQKTVAADVARPKSSKQISGDQVHASKSSRLIGGNARVDPALAEIGTWAAAYHPNDMPDGEDLERLVKLGKQAMQAMAMSDGDASAIATTSIIKHTPSDVVQSNFGSKALGVAKVEAWLSASGVQYGRPSPNAGFWNALTLHDKQAADIEIVVQKME